MEVYIVFPKEYGIEQTREFLLVGSPFLLSIKAMSDAKHMTSSRITALISVMLLISLLSVLSISLILAAGTDITHASSVSGSQVEHKAGFISSIGTNQTFVLKEADGKQEQFVCSAHCLQSESHMVRHKIEHAKTDVYYVQQGNQLVAIDVD
jgi:hypothetical protein